MTKYFGEVPRNPDAPVRPTVPPAALTKDTIMVMEDRVQLPRLHYIWHGVKAFSARRTRDSMHWPRLWPAAKVRACSNRWCTKSRLRRTLA